MRKLTPGYEFYKQQQKQANKTHCKMEKIATVTISLLRIPKLEQDFVTKCHNETLN